MKKYTAFALMIFAILFSSTNLSAQKQNTIPEKGYWVIESNIHNKNNAIVRFYDDNSVLIYQENVHDYRMNINRRKTLRALKSGLETAMIAWNNNKSANINGDLLAVIRKRHK